MPECFCEDGANEYAHQVIGTSRYEAAHGGLDWVISSCRECDGETLVAPRVHRRVGDRRTLGPRSCGGEWSPTDLWACDFCGAFVSAGEMTVCGDCFESRMSRS
jgi:hypothetical protein